MHVHESAFTSVRFDTKVAIVIRPALALWQKLNVTAFLASGIGGSIAAVIGQPYVDADGTHYLALCRQPITILEADASTLSSALQRALDRGLHIAVYTEQMFLTTNDGDNRAAVKAVSRDRLNRVGMGVYGPRGAVEKALKSVRLHL